MVTRQQKQAIVTGLVEKFKQTQSYYLVDFTKMTVAESLKLRRELKNLGVNYQIARNTLIARAIQEVGIPEVPQKALFGQTGIVFANEDAIAPAKIIKEQFEKTGKPVLKLAVIEGEFFDGSRLKEIAALPGKPELISGIIGSIHAPISGIVGAINAVMRDLASVIEEVAKQKAA